MLPVIRMIMIWRRRRRRRLLLLVVAISDKAAVLLAVVVPVVAAAAATTIARRRRMASSSCYSHTSIKDIDNNDNPPTKYDLAILEDCVDLMIKNNPDCFFRFASRKTAGVIGSEYQILFHVDGDDDDEDKNPPSGKVYVELTLTDYTERFHVSEDIIYRELH